MADKREVNRGVSTGLAIYIALQVVLGGFAALYGGTGTGDGRQTMIGLYVVLGLATVGMGLLCLTGGDRSKGVGMGMIIGWSVVSICTLGVCTGLNPGLYQDM